MASFLEWYVLERPLARLARRRSRARVEDGAALPAEERRDAGAAGRQPPQPVRAARRRPTACWTSRTCSAARASRSPSGATPLGFGRGDLFEARLVWDGEAVDLRARPSCFTRPTRARSRSTGSSGAVERRRGARRDPVPPVAPAHPLAPPRAHRRRQGLPRCLRLTGRARRGRRALRWSGRLACAVVLGVALIGAANVYLIARTPRGDRRGRRRGARAALRDRAREPRLSGRRPVARAGGAPARPRSQLYRAGRAAEDHRVGAASAGATTSRDAMAAWLEARGVAPADWSIDPGGHRTAATMADAAALGVRSAAGRVAGAITCRARSTSRATPASTRSASRRRRRAGLDGLVPGLLPRDDGARGDRRRGCGARRARSPTDSDRADQLTASADRRRVALQMAPALVRKPAACESRVPGPQDRDPAVCSAARLRRAGRRTSRRRTT